MGPVLVLHLLPFLFMKSQEIILRENTVRQALRSVLKGNGYTEWWREPDDS